MKTAIIYASKHGTTEKVVDLLAEKLTGDISLVNIQDIPDPSIASFDTVIIGGSIHAGMIQKSIKHFCEKNLDELLQKETGLFICCMLKEEAQEEFENAFPQALKDRARARGIFGGELLFEKMSFLEKFMVKKVAKVDKTVSAIDYAAIDQFVGDLSTSHATQN